MSTYAALCELPGRAITLSSSGGSSAPSTTTSYSSGSRNRSEEEEAQSGEQTNVSSGGSFTSSKLSFASTSTMKPFVELFRKRYFTESETEMKSMLCDAFACVGKQLNVRLLAGGVRVYSMAVEGRSLPKAMLPVAHMQEMAKR